MYFINFMNMVVNTTFFNLLLRRRPSIFGSRSIRYASSILIGGIITDLIDRIVINPEMQRQFELMGLAKKYYSLDLNPDQIILDLRKLRIETNDNFLKEIEKQANIKH